MLRLHVLGMGTSVFNVLRSPASVSVLASIGGYAVGVAGSTPPSVVLSTAPLPRVSVGTPICLDVACRAAVPVRPVPVPLTGSHDDVDAMTSMATAPSLVVPVPLPCVAGTHWMEDSANFYVLA